jgi:hypothetical protein
MRAISILAVTALALCGCQHITTKVPGVLDLRSDATEVPANPKAPAGARDGLDSWIKGDGVQGKDNITISDRKFWVIGLIPLRDDSGTELINQAMGDGVLRNVTIGEQVTVMDSVGDYCFLGVAIPCTLGIGSLLSFVMYPTVGLSPMDFKMTAVRAKAASGEPPPPTPSPAPGE